MAEGSVHLISALPPVALIGSSTERVEIPFTLASRITATKVFSAVRRGSRQLGR
jgi:hypothetical protein